jgi:hypothetical protein
MRGKSKGRSPLFLIAIESVIEKSLRCLDWEKLESHVTNTRISIATDK